jgi:2-dehydropantoate 2-reductase
MKIAIVGAGAMGGLFGARLALAGQDVSFVEASETTIEVISRQGLRRRRLTYRKASGCQSLVHTK